MRAQALSPRKAQVINAMVMRRSDLEHLTTVPSYERWGHILAFSTFTLQCDKHSTADIIVSFSRADQLVVRSIIPDGALFQHLVDRWHRERGATSSVTQMAMCQSYQRIIGLGRVVAVPLILNDLAAKSDDPDHWFWALQALTGEDPVTESDRGDMRQMARAWLEWGRQNGHA